jgi:hypothetical protein
MTAIYIVVSTIVFVLSIFSYPNTLPYYWYYRGVSIILALIGLALSYQILFHR